MNVNWNSPREVCKELRRLDEKYATERDSPLHHDNRCVLNHTKHPFLVA